MCTANDGGIEDTLVLELHVGNHAAGRVVRVCACINSSLILLRVNMSGWR